MTCDTFWEQFQNLMTQKNDVAQGIIFKTPKFIKLNLLQINQVYCWILYYKTHKHYSYLQWILIINYLQIVINIAKEQGLGWEPLSSIITEGGGAQGLKWRRRITLIKSRECFVKVNIRNWSKSLSNTSHE